MPLLGVGGVLLYRCVCGSQCYIYRQYVFLFLHFILSVYSFTFYHHFVELVPHLCSRVIMVDLVITACTGWLL